MTASRALPVLGESAVRFRVVLGGESPLRAGGRVGLDSVRAARTASGRGRPAARVETPPDRSAPPLAPVASSAEFGLDLIGTTVERYRLERRLGSGPYWAVFTARHESLNLAGLVWLLDRRELPADSPFANEFPAEAERALALRHPALLVPYVYSLTSDRAVLVTEWVDPMSAAAAVDEARRRPGPNAVQIVQQIAEGLAAAQEYGCLHRSIHPGVVFLRSGGKAKLGGLGWPTWLLGSARWAGFDGAPAPWLFCAPECLRDPRAGDVRSDLYSLGALLHYFLTDAPPYPAGSVAELVSLQEAGPVALSPKNYSPQLVDLVAALLQPDPARRPPDYRLILPTLQSTLLAERSRLARIKMENILDDLSAERAARATLREKNP